MKIALRRRDFIDRFTCADTWHQEFNVDDRTTEYGDMVQFYQGGYPFMAVPKGDFIIV